MTSYLIDGVLLAALLLTSLRVTSMYRELKRLRAYHDEYRKVFDQTRDALSGIENAVRNVRTEGTETLAALEARIEEARQLMAEMQAADPSAPTSAGPAEGPSNVRELRTAALEASAQIFPRANIVARRREANA